MDATDHKEASESDGEMDRAAVAQALEKLRKRREKVEAQTEQLKAAGVEPEGSHRA